MATTYFYTTSVDELITFGGSAYTFEGITCFVDDGSTDSIEGVPTVPLLRLLNSQTGDYFYTVDPNAAQDAVKNHGYTEDGTACFVLKDEAPVTSEISRYYNPTTKAHFYALSNDTKVPHGFELKGTAFYARTWGQAVAGAGLLPFYRLSKG